jgi:YVTN family beta-propeller protein
MGAPQAVTVFNTQTGAVLQTYKPFGSKSGSSTGITYTPNGAYLLFSQDGGYGPAYVAIASVNAQGLLSDFDHVSVPLDVNAGGYLTTVTCYPYTAPYNAAKTPPSGSPPGTTGSSIIPCGQTVSLQGDGAPTSYPMGISISSDGTTAYVVLDNNDTLTKIDLTQATPKEGPEIRVGNVPHSVVISPDGTTAYVSNEAGRIAKASDFQEYSNGTPVVASFPTGSTATGTISVVNLSSFTVSKSITVGLHPTGMAFWGTNLLVVNAYSDSISVINTATNTVSQTINLALPIKVPGEVVGVGPNSIAVDNVNNIAYVALYTANAVAVVDLPSGSFDPGRLRGELGRAGLD